MRKPTSTFLTLLSFHALRVVSYRLRARSVEVVVVSTQGDPAALASSVVRALDELRALDARRSVQVEHLLRRVIAVEHGDAFYEPALRACCLGPRALQLDPVRLASLIVHEATHARLHRLGFRGGPVTRAREEAMCVAESTRFLRRAGRPDWAEQEEARLAREVQSGNPWYSEQRLRETAESVMAAHGVPSWIRKVRHYLAGR